MIAVTKCCRSVNSRRTAASSASAVPSLIQRVASAIVTGEAITVAVRTDDANSQPERTSGTITYAMRKPGAEALGEPRDVPGQIGRKRRKSGGPVDRQESVRIVFDDLHIEAARNFGDFNPARG